MADAAWERVDAPRFVCVVKRAKRYPRFLGVCQEWRQAGCGWDSLGLRYVAPTFLWGRAVVAAGALRVRFLGVALCCACVSVGGGWGVVERLRFCGKKKGEQCSRSSVV